MQTETPWYAYPLVLAFYFLFEAFYRHYQKKFFATHMLDELLDTIKALKTEIGSDKEGARLCAWVVAISLLLSPVVVIGFTIAGVIKQENSHDLVLGLVLLLFLLPLTLGLRLVNHLFMSWIKVPGK